MVNWVLLTQILLCLYFLQILDFLVTDLYSWKRDKCTFSGKLSTRTDLVINFDSVKWITKINIDSYPNYNGKVEGGLSPETQNIDISKMYLHVVFKRHLSKLLDIM